MAFDVARIRGLFPALGDGWVHLDGTVGMQVPEQVATAVSTALRAPVSAPGGIFPASQRAEAIVAAARRAVADLVGADPAGVVLGPNAPVLLGRLAEALSTNWMLGDEVVCSRLDEQLNIAPWQVAAQRVGANVRWGEIDIETCELPSWQYDRLVTERTKVVAVTAASGSVGTRPDLSTIADAAHRVGAMLVVDASFAAPFMPLDIDELGADVLALSAQGWGGPTLGALVFADPRAIDRLPGYALAAEASGPERLEVGPHAHPALAGLVASVDYLAELDDVASGSRRERLLTSLNSARAYHSGLLGELLSELRMLPHVQLIGDAMRRIPVLAFTIARRKAGDVVEHLARRGLCAFADDTPTGVFGTLGVGEVGGAVRVGFAHYTNATEVTRLVDALAELR
ncbi:cysteine desulfurase family protein (TIGR01976 family) [Tamaricihabitans halophyticus]|uniref:Cysteine desulfurase family protein (TIGR01976 family) n=1 Tax=Tamaricihabitans halophyticus TaxID=1262583 RepID=A0A4R2R377_9PSEU|nr:cysteine desulfurase-like protein [Tamaricihabitans halophyticus]TCP57003.1 cysteine desulfurase family protein (TIGR01976 family) [Tamaricihabitans halophyticus]